MSEKEMNAYRLTGMKEPTDDMLKQLMKEVASEAKRKATEATEKLFKQLEETVAQRKKEWAERRNEMLHTQEENYILDSITVYIKNKNTENQ